MSTKSVTTQGQQEKLIDCLEKRPWLATGYARTAFSREKSRAAWQEISSVLNSDVHGCTKSPKQWAKYWKDKKSGVKKKYTLAMQRTDGDVKEEFTVTDIEQRIWALISRDQFAVGDTQFEIDPIQDSCLEVQQRTSSRSSENESQPPADVVESAPAPDSLFPTATSSPRFRRRVVPRRRLVRRSPLSLRQMSQMVRYTERLLAIEQQRVTTERMLAQNQRELIDALKKMSEAWLRQSQSFEYLINRIT